MNSQNSMVLLLNLVIIIIPTRTKNKKFQKTIIIERKEVKLMSQVYNLPRMRTIREAYKEIKGLDPNSAISERYLRDLAKTEDIGKMSGSKYLIDMDKLYAYLAA